MDAFGCDRCQQIFVVTESGDQIEQVSSGAIYRRLWRWAGTRWLSVRPPLRENYLPITLWAGFVLVLAWLPLIVKGLAGTAAWLLPGLLVIGLPLLLLWLAYRR